MASIFDLFSRIETGKTASPSGAVTAIVVGLGNPGREYENTRHNMGFLCIDTLAKECNATVKCARFRSLCGEAIIGGQRVLLLKPQTYMNLSGGAVREAADFYKIPPERVFVLCDDTALPAGKMRVRQKGSAGGHNGLKDMIAALGTEAFPRIRFGVGAPPAGGNIANWVIGGMPPSDREKVNECFARALPCLSLMLEGDFSRAMNQYN